MWQEAETGEPRRVQQATSRVGAAARWRRGGKLVSNMLAAAQPTPFRHAHTTLKPPTRRPCCRGRRFLVCSNVQAGCCCMPALLPLVV